jgi:NAD(P)-dependent dehydrogenase (short-subunit alcohol dehydrogenase family)
MKDLAGKVAVVTGAGSGIGRGVAVALAEAGMKVVIADVDEASAKTVAGELGPPAIAVQTDVADRDSVESLADRAYGEFGAVHVLHNNAGVAIFLPVEQMTDDDWRFTFSVNLMGVVNGIQAFLPRLRAQGGEAHIVNTASMAGMIVGPGLAAYNATKFAVVAISETLRQELAGTGIGVSVLCPGVVATDLVRTTLRRRPLGGADMQLPNFDAVSDPALAKVLMPEDVGRMVRRAVEDDELYIFTHPEWGSRAKARFDNILAAFERAKERANA